MPGPTLQRPFEGRNLVGVSSAVLLCARDDQQSRLTGILNPNNEQTTMLCDALDREYHRVLANGVVFEVVAASCSLNHANPGMIWDANSRETLIQNISAAGVSSSPEGEQRSFLPRPLTGPVKRQPHFPN